MLSLNQIHKSFAGRAVLQGLSLRLEPGRIYGLLGPNGAGKSTAIACLVGAMSADSGTVQGADPRRIGIVSQEPALYPDLSVRQNLAFFGRVHGLAGSALRARIAELLAELGLDAYAEHRARQLSGGWQRRLHLAIALVHRPDFLILDEPTASVDLEARHGLWELFRRLRDRGMGLLLTTHHLEEAEALCDRIGLLHGGRLLAEGSAAELAARVPAKAVAYVETGDEPGLRRRAETQGWPLRDYGGRAALLLPDYPDLTELVSRLDGLALRSAALAPVRLEHAYCELLAGAC